jgi:hypothetical protein
MASIDTARGIYEDAASTPQRADQFARGLEERAKAVREQLGQQKAAISSGVRSDIQDALTEDDLDRQDVEDVAKHLEEAANGVRSSVKSTTIMEDLPDGVAGQAHLGTDSVQIDPNAIQSADQDRIIDRSIAEDVQLHEDEHTQQSPDANADGINVNGKSFDLREIREAAAISIQERTDFLSAEYKRITQELPMDAGDRELVRDGDIIELARKKGAQVEDPEQVLAA